MDNQEQWKNALDELDRALDRVPTRNVADVSTDAENTLVEDDAPDVPVEAKSDEAVPVDTAPDEATPDEAIPAESTPAEKTTSKSKKKIRKAERRLGDFQDFALKVLLFLVVVYVLFGYIIGVATAPNRDMYPRIDNGDLLLYYRLDKDPKAQDIVVFVKNDTRYVGRVVAVQSDTIEITDGGGLIINGNSMLESNIFYETYPLEGFVEYPLTLGTGECFILMDGRRGAEDSRYFGPVKYDELLGTVFTVIRRNNL